jgi:hypothetical protein
VTPLVAFLRKLEPTRPTRIVPNWDEDRYQQRFRTWLAVRDVLTTLGTGSDLRRAVAVSMAAATRRDADLADVWRRVRRFRELNRSVPEQLRLPLD